MYQQFKDFQFFGSFFVRLRNILRKKIEKNKCQIKYQLDTIIIGLFILHKKNTSL